MSQDSGEERNLPPTPRRLKKLREDGQVPRSRDLVSGLVLVAIYSYVAAAGGDIVSRIDRALSVALDGRGEFDARLSAALNATLDSTASILLPLFGVLAFAVLAATLIDARGFTPSGSALTPSFAKLNPAAGLKQIFGLRHLLDLGKGLFKAVVVIGAFVAIAGHFLNDIFWAPTCGASCVGLVLKTTAGWALMAGAAVALLGGLADVPISRWLFRRDNRMTLSELKREIREDMGDPAVVRARHQVRNAVLGGKILRGIENATALLTSEMSALAVAYRRGRTPAPVVVAKGYGAQADALRAEARARGVPVLHAPGLPERMLKSTRIGQPIPKVFFDEVAALLVAASLTQ